MFDQVTVDKDIYEDVDEETYKEIVRKRREEDFIEDDGTQPPESCARTRGSSNDWPSACCAEGDTIASTDLWT